VLIITVGALISNHKKPCTGQGFCCRNILLLSSTLSLEIVF